MRIIIQKFLDILTDIHGRVELLVVAPISNQILFEGLDLTQPLPQYHLNLSLAKARAKMYRSKSFIFFSISAYHSPTFS